MARKFFFLIAQEEQFDARVEILHCIAAVYVYDKTMIDNVMQVGTWTSITFIK